MIIAVGAACISALMVSDVRSATVEASCAAAPITHSLPDTSMKNLSRNWVHVGKLWMGYIIGEPGFVADPDGQKIPWYRSKGSAFGKLRVSGSRVDGDAAPLRVWIPSGYAT